MRKHLLCDVMDTEMWKCIQTEKLASCVRQQIEVMHDYQGNRSCLYGPSPETDSEVEDNPEQVTRYVIPHLTSDLNLDLQLFSSSYMPIIHKARIGLYSVILSIFSSSV